MERPRPRSITTSELPKPETPTWPISEEALVPAQDTVQDEQVCKYLLHLENLMKKFKAGQVSKYLHKWETMTSDPEILQMVTGDLISFVSDPPERNITRKCNVSKDTRELMDIEIQNMLEKDIIVECSHEPGEFISPIFPVLKSDGGMRIILNLKEFNESVEYLHFKMDSIKVVLANVTEGCFMASLDLKQAYHSIRIHDESTPILFERNWTSNHCLY